VDVEATASPFLDQGVKAIQVLLRDITERKQAEQELRERTEELLASNTELEKFAYVASHDLQEPLRMVTNYTELLQRRYQGKLDSDADEFIAYAVDGAARMRTLIDELLAYSRVGTQGAPFVLTALEGVLADVLQGLEVALSEAGAVVSRDPLPELRCDKTQIARVFQNLIVNGVKFHGADPPAIHVGARREGEEWVFSVKDNGIGIDPEYFDRIFIIFQRLQSRVEYEGTGMGLAIGKRVIERHGGRIWVESLPGAGSTFYFTLPADPKESE
jgi:light-regulated signal transduction histidine kinase (bacteriophytochrome)